MLPTIGQRVKWTDAKNKNVFPNGSTFEVTDLSSFTSDGQGEGAYPMGTYQTTGLHKVGKNGYLLENRHSTYVLNTELQEMLEEGRLVILP